MKLWTPYFFTLHYQHPSLCLRKSCWAARYNKPEEAQIKKHSPNKKVIVWRREKTVGNLASISISARIKKESHIIHNTSVRNSHNCFPHCQQLFSLFPPYRSGALVAHTQKDKYQNCCSALVAHSPLTHSGNLSNLTVLFSSTVQLAARLKKIAAGTLWWPLLAQKSLSKAN